MRDLCVEVPLMRVLRECMVVVVDRLAVDSVLMRSYIYTKQLLLQGYRKKCRSISQMVDDKNMWVMMLVGSYN